MALSIPNLEAAPSFAAQSVLDATDIAAIVAALPGSAGGTSVVSGGAVSADTSMTVSVSAGSGLSTGTTVSWSSGTATAGAASASDRKDIVVVTSSGTLSVIAGTPCGTAGWSTGSNGNPPVKPALPTGDILLAELYIAATTTTVASANITDKRVVIGPDGTLGIVPLGTVTTTASFPALTYSVATATLTAGDTCVFTLPAANALPGASFLAVITNPASGTVDVPTFAGAGSDTITLLGSTAWNTAHSAVNIVQFTNLGAGVWTEEYVTSSVLESVYTNSSASGTVALQDVAATGYTTQVYSVPNGDTLTLQNPTYRAGGRITVRVITGTGTTVNLPSSNTRYGAGGVSAAGSSFTIPASAVVELVVSMIDGTNYDYSPPVRYA